MSFRSVAVLALMLTTAPFGLLVAQQSVAPANAPTPSGTPTTAAAEASATVTPGPAVPQPQYSPLFQKSDPAPALGTNDNAAVASEGKSHTIVLSTLAIVLIAVLLAVLIF
jgi:hypothetical protein